MFPGICTKQSLLSSTHPLPFDQLPPFLTPLSDHLFRGELDPNAIKGALAGAAQTTTQKLGPRANQGAINAGLRALDRSGKPCRKWEKKGFVLKSFTGVQWDVPTWRAPKKLNVDENGDVKSDTTSISDAKGNNGSSAVSEKSNSGVDTTGTPNASQLVNSVASPAPAVAA